MDVFVVMVADACLLYLILDTGGNFAVGFRSQPSFVDSQQRKYLGIGQGGWVMRDTRCPETAGGCNVAAVVFGVLVDSKVGSDDADGRLLCPVGQPAVASGSRKARALKTTASRRSNSAVICGHSQH